MEELLSQLTSAAIVIYGLQLLKHSRFFPWVTSDTKKLNRLLGAAGAAMTAVGIHAAWDAHGGVLTISGLTLGNIAHGLWHWANAFAVQQLAYDAVVSKQVTGGTHA